MYQAQLVAVHGGAQVARQCTFTMANEKVTQVSDCCAPLEESNLKGNIEKTIIVSTHLWYIYIYICVYITLMHICEYIGGIHFSILHSNFTTLPTNTRTYVYICTYVDMYVSKYIFVVCIFPQRTNAFSQTLALLNAIPLTVFFVYFVCLHLLTLFIRSHSAFCPFPAHAHVYINGACTLELHATYLLIYFRQPHCVRQRLHFQKVHHAVNLTLVLSRSLAIAHEMLNIEICIHDVLHEKCTFSVPFVAQMSVGG